MNGRKQVDVIKAGDICRYMGAQCKVLRVGKSASDYSKGVEFAVVELLEDVMVGDRPRHPKGLGFIISPKYLTKVES